MIAFRAAAELDMLRPSIVRVHETPIDVVDRLNCAPAMSFPQFATVEQAIDVLRQMQSETDSIYYLFVTDFCDRLVGVVNLHHLITAEPATQLYEIMDRHVITLSHEASLAEQAHLLSQSGLMALPIVDDEGRLIGAMDASDLITAVEQEASKKIYHLAGMGNTDTRTQPLGHVVRHRLGWMMVHLTTLLLAAWVVTAFEGVIANIVMLAAFIPLIIGQGNRAVTQSLTLVVRSFTLGELRLEEMRRLVRNELVIGLVNGLSIGTLIGMIAWFWQGSVALGVIGGVAMMVNFLLAALAGVLVPLGLKALRYDPTLAAKISAPVFTNIGGLLCLLGLSALALNMGYL